VTNCQLVNVVKPLPKVWLWGLIILLHLYLFYPKN